MEKKACYLTIKWHNDFILWEQRNITKKDTEFWLDLPHIHPSFCLHLECCSPIGWDTHGYLSCDLVTSQPCASKPMRGQHSKCKQRRQGGQLSHLDFQRRIAVFFIPLTFLFRSIEATAAHRINIDYFTTFSKIWEFTNFFRIFIVLLSTKT